jgi:hypothetical protein
MAESAQRPRIGRFGSVVIRCQGVVGDRVSDIGARPSVLRGWHGEVELSDAQVVRLREAKGGLYRDSAVRSGDGFPLPPVLLLLKAPNGSTGPGLAALLTTLRCLRRPGRVEPLAPFSPARVDGRPSDG